VQSFPLTLAAILTIAALLAVIRATDARTRRAAQEREAMLRALQRSAAELHANNRRLAESNRDLTDFAYVASHDLQEPLRKITAFGERLRVRCGDRLGDDGRDYLARMTSASTRMGHLIDDLLTYSRITTRGAAFVATDVGSIARGVLSDLEVAIERAGATVELGPLATIEADPTQLRQLLQNLVGNALKFRRHDVTPFVSVSMERVQAQEAAALDAGLPGAGGWWRLEVRDNGIGFDPRDSERIFSLFQRLHARSSDPGSGIGLTVCRRIVERHHGEIRAFGTPGSGATFRVVLPSVQPRDNGDPGDDVTTDELELPAELLFSRVLQPA
jgi:light-regulated signal transduction histidine kinase (bacteriophytochrome)